MARKTFSVEEFTNRANDTLANTPLSEDFRRGIITALEHILFESDNYRGFRYLTVNEVPAGQRPGINISPIDGQHLEDYDARFADTDRTRVRYF